MVLALYRFAPLLMLALLWEAVVQSGLINAATLPPLSGIVAALWRMLQGDMLYHLGQSLWRGAAGFTLAVLIGPVCGILMARYRPLRQYLNPLLQCTYPIPKTALLPLLIIWLGLGSTTKVTLIFIGCLLPIVISSFNAARGVPRALIWSARSFGVSEWRLIWEIVLPASLPEILSGVRTSLAIGFILLVTSELIIASNGIGFLIANVGGVGDYQGMFAAVIAISAIGFAADRAYAKIARRLLAWREVAHG